MLSPHGRTVYKSQSKDFTVAIITLARVTSAENVVTVYNRVAVHSPEAIIERVSPAGIDITGFDIKPNKVAIEIPDEQLAVFSNWTRPTT